MIDKFQIQKLEAMPIEGVAERLGLHVERHKAICPFHDDTRPSLTFNTYRNRFRCFVCDAHGGPIDLVMRLRNLNFREACAFLDSSVISAVSPLDSASSSSLSGIAAVAPKERSRSGLSGSPSRASSHPLDLEWLTALIRTKVLVEPARRFLFDERHIDPRVVEWCGLTSIMQPQPCWRYGKPFYDAPSLLIPYYDQDGRLRSVQSRYLGNIKTADSADLADKKSCSKLLEVAAQEERGATLCTASAVSALSAVPSQTIPRFKFPRGSNCHIYNLPVLKLLKPGEPLWIAEGCSDCWALLSSGRKAIAIPSATLLRDDDLSLLSTLNTQLSTTFHIFPDQDAPGEKLFLELKARLPNLERHQLPPGCKDFSDYWASRFLPF